MSATQPITLITATPGGGKTALAVKIMREAIAQGRPLFQSGIPELKLPYVPLPPIHEWTELRPDPDNPDFMLPYFTFPENSLVVLDEAQRIFRVRPTGSKVPEHVAAFETVRHTGVTFLLITQSPSFLDAHIRKLVGQHIHLRDVGVLGRWYYEWPESANPENFSTAPIKKKWKLPRDSFPLYKSSSLHIKRQYSFPPVLMLLLLCLVGVAFGAWRLYGSIDSKMTPAKPVEQSTSSAVSHAKPAPMVPVSVLTGADYLASFVPSAPGMPESAPAYSGLRQVKTMPRVAAGICTPTRCSCYTQQGTDAGLDDMQCRSWLKNPPFDPYRDEYVPAPVGADVVESTKIESGSVGRGAT